MLLLTNPPQMFQFEYFPSNKGTLVGDEWVVCAEPPMRDSSDPSFNSKLRSLP